MLQRLLDVSAQLQQSQADFLGSQRRSAELQTQLDASSTKVQSLEEINAQLTQASCTCSWKLKRHLHPVEEHCACMVNQGEAPSLCRLPTSNP